MRVANEATPLGSLQGSEETLLHDRAASLGRVLCLIGAAAGAVGLLGWITGISFLTTLVPGEPQMKANTALSLLLLGVAGALRHHEATPRAVRLLANATALIALAIGIGTTIEYAAGRDLGIDQLLFEAGAGPYPGRPSPPTAVAVALLAGASLLFDSRRRARARPSEWMILGGGLLAFAAIVGAALGAAPLYRMRSAPVTGVAVPTAVGLLLISVGMLLERPAAGIAQLATSPAPGGALLRRLVLPGIILPVLLAFGLSRVFTLVGIQDVALLFATLVALTTVGGLALLVTSAAPLDRAHKALAASREETRELVQQAPDGIFVADLDGRYTDVNRAGCEMLGYSKEEIVGKTIVDLIPPEDVGRLAASKQHLLAGKAEVSEWWLLRKDATYLPVELNAKILPDGRWQAFVRDISDRKRAEAERKRAEKALRFSEAKFSGIVSISADAIISIDEQQKITVFNTGAETIFGYSRDEVLDAPLDRLIPERFRERHREHVAKFAASQVAARRMGERPASIRGRRKNGEEFPAEASISNLKVGDATLLTVVLRDVTERERFEREQRTLAEVGVVLAGTLDYEQTLATVARIAVRDFADWCMVEVIEASEGLQRLKVVSADPAKTPIADQLEHIKLDRERPFLAKAVVDSGQPRVVPRLTAADLEAAAQSPLHLQALRALLPASMMSVPLMLREQPLGALTFISSNPSRLYGPTDLRLAMAIAERASRAIENARLYRAALHANGMRDQVLGVVAHDLRNPLSTIALHASALRRPGHQPERRNQQHKEAIERGTRRMNRLIQDLLDVAVLESGQLKVEKAQLSPSDLLGEAVEMQRALAAATSIELRVDAAPDIPPILGDRERLLQVFENLIGNALKFTEAGGQVTAGVAPGESGALFWVADTGRGMTPEELARVFDRFWQASARSGRLGAGLGLPITKGIVEAHGGRIWVESAPGQGSTFFFSIPLAAPRAVAASDVVH